MPEYYATFYSAIVLIWYLDRVARNDRRKRQGVWVVRYETCPANAP